MTTVLLAQVELAASSGAPEDTVVNTWHFRSDEIGTPAQDHGAINAALVAFYSAIDQYMSKFNSGVMTVRTYDLKDPQPRVPTGTSQQSLTFDVAGGVPCEVAVCLSYHAALVSGTNPARRRGRVYIGPLSSNGIAEAGSHTDMEISGPLLGALTTAGSALLGGHAAGAGEVTWVTYSPTDAATTGVEAAANEVVGGWVDWALDTQRRRGRAPRGRNLWS